MGVPELPEGYRLKAILQEGQAGTVLRALRPDGTDCVLRVERGSAGVQLSSELAVLAQVDHPGIAKLLDHGTLPGGGVYVAREWVEGQEFEVWSAGRSPEDKGRLIARLCPALEHLHRLGFVHGDLSPHNVIVQPNGRPVLCDFGLARRRGAGRSAAGIGGSFFYIAPEILLDSLPSPSADLFALGALLHRSLTESKCTASEFYAQFPSRSFLDASRSSPEEIPPWGRDLVCALTSRAPERRPRSAMEVGLELASRLGITIGSDQVVRDLRWPASQGREAWANRWFQEILELEDEGPQWLLLPEGEDPRGMWEYLRLYASLRGRSSRGIDLDTELERIADGAELDRWIASLVGSEPWIVICAHGAGPWSRRALASMARASRFGVDPSRVCVVSPWEPPAGQWARRLIPPVEEGHVVQFVSTYFEAGEEQRLRTLAGVLHQGSRGAASRLDQLLRAAQDRGWILRQGERFRLREGSVESIGEELAAPASIEEVPLEGQEVLVALDLCGDEAGLGDVAEVLGYGEEEFARRLTELSRGRRVEILSTPSGMRVRSRVRIRSHTVGSDRIRELHRRRARNLRSTSAPRAWHDAHALCADPGPETTYSLVESLQSLREIGEEEKVLEVVERLEAMEQSTGMDVLDSAPEVHIEYAEAWCGLGQLDRALDVLARLEGRSEPRILALAEIVRAQVDDLRHERERAFERCRRAVSLDPSIRPQAEVARVRLLHSSGADEEVLAAVRDLRPRELAERGELSFRKRVYAESLAALSALRLGQTEAARRTTRELIADAQEAGDSGTEGLLRINLATIERKAGSLAQAKSELQAAERLFEAAGRIASLAHARATLGAVLREMGELASAEPLLASAIAIRERLGDHEGVLTTQGIAGLCSFERGHARKSIETLTACMRSFHPVQRERHAPLLRAKVNEMRSRLGAPPEDSTEENKEQEADPRILLSKGRAAWMRAREGEALAYLSRAEGLARSLKLTRPAQEAAALAHLIEGPSQELSTDTEPGSVFAEDLEILELLQGAGRGFDRERAIALAHELENRGRDDRAARVWFAVAARSEEEDPRARDHAQRAFDACVSGLTEGEREAFRLRLLGLPDPFPGDFTPRREEHSSEEDFEMDVIALLDINERLVQQQDLDTLLGVIVESALSVTGAERGFLVLEEQGELRFDKALDSCRGDIDAPEFEISQTVVREALQRMQPLRVSNAVEDPLIGHNHSVVSLELRSILCVPIHISEGLRAAIYLDHRLRTGAFGENAERLSSLLANQAALAIQQVTRLEEIRQLNGRLEKRIQRQASDLETAKRKLQRAGLGEAPTPMVGKSRAMGDVRSFIERVAERDITVLITGRSGTGKEVAARLLHDSSPRKSATFVSESCAALPPTLIESELFGYRKGAFTGANADREGLFERAQGGTLFLDEIGEMPLELQAKLLRVLESNEIRRLGDTDVRRVDFRLVVATNRDLEVEVRTGNFREDLFFRLDGMRIVMPALEERAEDIPDLVRHFLSIEQAKDGIQRRVSPKVLARLCERPWPGNVRELRNEVVRMCVLSEGDLLDPDLVRRPIQAKKEAPGVDLAPLAEIERRAILQALEHTGGDKRKAAEILGVSRAKIYQRLKEWREEES